MRIGLFTDAYFPIISGVSISVETLRKELVKLGHTVFVITNNHEHATPQPHVVRLGGYRLPMKGLREYRIGKVTKEKVKKVCDLQLDLIHCHTEFTMGRVGRKAAKCNNVPVVHTYHTMYEDYVHFVSKTLARPLRFGSRIFSRKFAESADLVIFPTIKVKRTFDRYGYKKPSHIVPTGIYLEQFAKNRYTDKEIAALKRKYGIQPDDFVLLYLGRMSREKSIGALLKQFVKIPHKNVKLVLVGGGPDKEEFAEYIHKHGKTDHVVFTGMIDPQDVGKYYRLGDVFVNFSVTETQGLTYIEALSSGLPLLVKYDDNLEDVLVEGHNGFSFHNDEDFGKLFDKLYHDTVLLSQVSQHANEAIDKFSAENYAKTIESLYKTLL